MPLHLGTCLLKLLLLLMTLGRSDSPNHEGVACQLT